MGITAVYHPNPFFYPFAASHRIGEDKGPVAWPADRGVMKPCSHILEGSNAHACRNSIYSGQTCKRLPDIPPSESSPAAGGGLRQAPEEGVSSALSLGACPFSASARQAGLARQRPEPAGGPRRLRARRRTEPRAGVKRDTGSFLGGVFFAEKMNPLIDIPKPRIDKTTARPTPEEELD